MKHKCPQGTRSTPRGHNCPQGTQLPPGNTSAPRGQGRPHRDTVAPREEFRFWGERKFWESGGSCHSSAVYVAFRAFSFWRVGWFESGRAQVPRRHQGHRASAKLEVYVRWQLFAERTRLDKCELTFPWIVGLAL
eukprot:scaffold509_cov315-Pavlova_lutheri.AAC.8